MKQNQMMFPQNDLLFVKLQLKKTISECRKYSFFAWLFSLHFHICTVVKEQDMYINLKEWYEECNFYWGLTKTLPLAKGNANGNGKTKQNKTEKKGPPFDHHFICPKPLALYTTVNFLLDAIIARLLYDWRTIPYRLYRKKEKLKNKYFTTIHALSRNCLYLPSSTNEITHLNDFR